ncbi:MAG: thiamine phosphate synthase [Thermoanaerobaculia bacterium]
MRAPAGPSGRIYAIADVEALHPVPLPAAVRDMVAAGIRWIQVRAKQLPGGELCRQVEACCRILEGSGVRLWVDDRADVAALFPVAGLHVGQTDLPPAAARKVIGDEMWIGLSTHDEGQLRAADADPEVDVIAVGPVFPTTGKASPDSVVGLDFLRRARSLTAKPLVAIGGIDAGNIAGVIAAGVDAAAVIGAVCRGDVRVNALRLLQASAAAWGEQSACGST